MWQITEDTVGQIETSDKPVIIDVSATWCGACRTMAPVFDEMSEEYQDTIQFAKMDIDSQQRLAKKFGVKALPTILFFKAGQKKPLMKHTGAMTKDEFEAQIKQFLQRAK
jgi:thioredoxin 1